MRAANEKEYGVARVLEQRPLGSAFTFDSRRMTMSTLQKLWGNRCSVLTRKLEAKDLAFFAATGPSLDLPPIQPSAPDESPMPPLDREP